MDSPENIAPALELDGYSVVPAVIADQDLGPIIGALAEVRVDKAGTRKMLELGWCAALADDLRKHPSLTEVIPADYLPVQCTFFAKTLENNWLVSLHQDLSIPVAERIESASCTGWSEKQGEIFVQPPISFLERILAIRLHLDSSDESNGAMRVVRGSHRLGRADAQRALKERSSRGEQSVPVPAGGAMVMRPLLLHASSKSVIDSTRRVLHFVFAPAMLPEGLRWAAR